MKRIDQWRAKLRTARAEIKHKERQLNAAQRSYQRALGTIQQLEKKIEIYLAKTK